jgi:tRNA (guanine26-N2/guanine27-N2)-dimethyltransferase
VDLVLYREGKVEVLVPNPSESWKSADVPVFFNPRAARVNRDVSVLVLSVLKPQDVLDGMTASGIRGVRYFVESGIPEVHFNDLNGDALELARRNAEKYGVNGTFFNEDFNVLCHTSRFWAVDLDPFGSPAPFIWSAARVVRSGGYLLVSATDTRPLSGASPKQALAKYGIVLRKPEWYPELMARVLYFLAFHAAAIHGKGIEPVLAFAYEHHVRVITRLREKPSLITKNAKKIGFYEAYGRQYGPIWLGPLQDKDVARRALERWDDDYTKASRKILELASVEPDVVGYYNVHFWAEGLKLKQIPKFDSIMAALREQGYTAERVLWSDKGIKTDADAETFQEVLMRAAKD